MNLSKLYRRQFISIVFIPIIIAFTETFSQPINVGILYSRNESDSIFWSSLNANWSQFGNIEIQIDYTTMMRDSIIYDSLNHNNFDVIIIDNALSNFGQQIYSDDEIAAITLYVQFGHGLIITGGTLRSNGQLEGLLGFWGIAGQAMYNTGITDSIEILDNTSYLFKNLPTYKTYNNNTLFYGGQDWANDGGKGHISDWEIRLIDEDASLVGMIWNYVSGELRGSAITVNNSTNYRTVFCGHPPVNEQSVNDDYQFVYNMIVYTSGIISSVENDSFTKSYVLEQNYPNPFNPSTTISFSLPFYGFATLKIFNPLGEVVAVLLNKELTTGTYEVEWNAAGLPSGIYFYQLKTEGFVESKKMILMK